MQLASHNRNRHGGRRIANFGRTFELRKELLMDRDNCRDTAFQVCTCEPHCAFECAQQLPDYTDRVESLRSPRFEGKSLARAKVRPFIVLARLKKNFRPLLFELVHPGVKIFWSSMATSRWSHFLSVICFLTPECTHLQVLCARSRSTFSARSKRPP